MRVQPLKGPTNIILKDSNIDYNNYTIDIIDIHLLLAVPEEIADPDVPEVCECDELTVLLLLTLPSTLLTDRADSVHIRQAI